LEEISLGEQREMIGEETKQKIAEISNRAKKAGCTVEEIELLERVLEDLDKRAATAGMVTSIIIYFQTGEVTLGALAGQEKAKEMLREEAEFLSVLLKTFIPRYEGE
jgi:hypothetical protein